MSLVHNVYAQTKELNSLLEEVSETNREQTIEKVEQLLAARQLNLDKLNGTYSDEEKTIGQEIIKLNKLIDERLGMLMTGIKRDMNHVKKQKTSNQSYVNPYKDVTIDGMFFDKKK